MRFSSRKLHRSAREERPDQLSDPKPAPDPEAQPAGGLPATTLAPDLASMSAAHKRFAEEWLKIAGEKGAVTSAYMRAYPRTKSRRTASVEGGRLARDPRVVGYIALLREKMLDQSVTSLVQCEQALARIAFCDLRKVFVPGKGGGLRDPSEWPDEIALALSGYSEHPTKYGDSKSVKLPDRNQALRTLVEMKGGLRPVSDPNEKAPRATFIFNMGPQPGAGKRAAIADQQPQERVIGQGSLVTAKQPSTTRARTSGERSGGQS